MHLFIKEVCNIRTSMVQEKLYGYHTHTHIYWGRVRQFVCLEILIYLIVTNSVKAIKCVTE